MTNSQVMRLVLSSVLSYDTLSNLAVTEAL
jgi:hypothetical protein